MDTANNMPVWLFRCNYIDLGSKMPQYKDVTSLYEHNRCPITILFSETWDKYCYKELHSGKKSVSWEAYAENHPNETKSNIPSYVDRFVKLAYLAKVQDVLVILEFKDDGKGIGNKPEKKIGIIRKGCSIELIKGDSYEIFYLELDTDSVITIPNNKFTILNGLIPSNVTLGPIQSRANAINELYHFIRDKRPIKRELQNLPNEKIEDLCCKWLQSKYAKEFQLKSVYVANGKSNFPVLDILGKTEENGILAAQVSYTENIGTIVSKIKKLVEIEFDIHLMFTNLTKDLFTNSCKKKGEEGAKPGTDVKHVQLETVWDNLINDDDGRSYIEDLFSQSYYH